jgi:hypothetical protein
VPSFIANTSMMGDDLLIITSKYDSWRGPDGVTRKHRLEVLALEPSGRQGYKPVNGWALWLVDTPTAS